MNSIAQNVSSQRPDQPVVRLGGFDNTEKLLASVKTYVLNKMPRDCTEHSVPRMGDPTPLD